MRSRLAVAGLVTISAFLPSAAAADDPLAGGGTSGDKFFVGIIAPGQDGGSENVSTGDPNGPPAYKYTWVPAGIIAGRGQTCDAGFGQPGWPHMLVVQDLSGAIVSQEPQCVALNPDGSIPAPPALPPVPSIGEIWRAALRQIPPPKIGMNPRPTGLTGLDTWLWYEGPAELQVSTSIGPWTVTGTARVQDVVFEMGEGRTVRSTGPGSEANPAARYVYETKGQYRIVATARWGADFLLTGPGLPPRSTPMGVAVLRSSEDYPVQEVRGLLLPDRPGT